MDAQHVVVCHAYLNYYRNIPKYRRDYDMYSLTAELISLGYSRRPYTKLFITDSHSPGKLPQDRT